MNKKDNMIGRREGVTTLRCDILDEGMIHLLTKDVFLKITLKSKEGEYFELKSIEKIHEKNKDIFHQILDMRNQKVRRKLIHFLTEGKSYLLFGTRIVNEISLNLYVYKQTHKDVVLLYTPKINFLPGIFYLRETIKKRAS